MDNVIKKEFSLGRLAKASLTLGLMAFIGLSIFVYLSLHFDVSKIVTRQAMDSVANISELNVDSVSRAIINRGTLLQVLSEKLEKKNMYQVDVILEELEDYADAYDFYSMGVMDEEFRVHFTDGRTVDASQHPQYQAAWTEEFKISESYMPVTGGSYAVNLLSRPVFRDGEIKYVLIATYYSKNLTERMNISSMNGKGYNFLLNGNGNVVIYPKHYADKTYNGLMKYVNETSEIIPNESGDDFFEYGGERYYAHFEPLGIEDWSLMTCAREQDVFRDANVIVIRVAWGMGILWIMILFAIVMTAYSIYQSKRNLRKAVFYDELLGIGNGSFLDVYFKQLSKEELEHLFLVFFDIDKFKEFNYIYGEENGDRLLQYIARVFREELPDDRLFRYLSDNFAVLVHATDREEFSRKFDRVLNRFSSDMEHGVIQPFDVSAGVRKLQEGDNLRRATSDALIARGTIKGIQVQQYAFHDEEILHRRMHYMEMESDFARALKEKEFHVYYQPKYDMRTGHVIGAEALVRWVRKDGTIISPGEFIPCFEASRQIVLLDEVMLESVCRQMKEMEREGLSVKKVSVNLSRVHLRRQGILPKIERIVRDSGVDPSKIAFEITESALYEDSIPLKNIVDFLHDLGCWVDMDDYGVGVSGPNALAVNKFDVVKMDKSFIDGIGDERMEAVIQSTINLSKTLGMDILAEGVEEQHQVESLVKWGCNVAQGFYYSPPVPEEEYRKLLREDEARRSS